MKLLEIAEIQSGLVLNRKEANSERDTVRVYQRLNIRSLNEDGIINHDHLDDFNSKVELESTLLAHENDIILKLFAPFYPTLIQKEDEGLVIPSQLAVIRVIEKTILPSYLCYWLSTPEAADIILFHEGWQSQRSIRISTLAKLEVPVPSLETQKTISDIVSLKKQRQNLYQALIEEEEKLTSLTIQQAIGGKQK